MPGSRRAPRTSSLSLRRRPCVAEGIPHAGRLERALRTRASLGSTCVRTRSRAARGGIRARPRRRSLTAAEGPKASASALAALIDLPGEEDVVAGAVSAPPLGPTNLGGYGTRKTGASISFASALTGRPGPARARPPGPRRAHRLRTSSCSAARSGWVAPRFAQTRPRRRAAPAARCRHRPSTVSSFSASPSTRSPTSASRSATGAISSCSSRPSCAGTGRTGPATARSWLPRAWC